MGCCRGIGEILGKVGDYVRGIGERVKKFSGCVNFRWCITTKKASQGMVLLNL